MVFFPLETLRPGETATRDEASAVPASSLVHPVGVVIIGRNEGDRLKRCFDSVKLLLPAIVYVDSGSVDDSVQAASERGIDVVELTPEIGFTAARARNAGFRRLTALFPDLAYVQFVDGDCELQPDWISAALAEIIQIRNAAAICGRRRERDPARSRYNQLCDMEWDTPVGLASTCGGDALMRVAAFRAVGGFNPKLIAGEEPDLCHRMRENGWTIHRLEQEMTVHDAGMTRVGQWWQRNRRSGYAMAEAVTLRGRSDPREIRRVLSNIFWGTPLSWPLWPLLWMRLSCSKGALYATFITIGKIPHLQGQVDYWVRKKSLIEYK